MSVKSKRDAALDRIHGLRWNNQDRLDGYARGYLDGFMVNLPKQSTLRIVAACDFIDAYLARLDERTRRGVTAPRQSDR